MQDSASGAAAEPGLETLDLHSGAAHDAMHVVSRIDSGTLSAPSQYGASHNSGSEPTGTTAHPRLGRWSGRSRT